MWEVTRIFRLCWVQNRGKPVKLATREMLLKSTRKGGLRYIYQRINYSINYQFSQGTDGKRPRALRICVSSAAFLRRATLRPVNKVCGK